MSTGKLTVAVLFGCEGNRRSGVTLAMCHRLCGMSIYRVSDIKKGDEHSAQSILRYVVWRPLPILMHSTRTLADVVALASQVLCRVS